MKTPPPIGADLMSPSRTQSAPKYCFSSYSNPYPVLYILLKDIKTTFYYTKTVFMSFKRIYSEGQVVASIADMTRDMRNETKW
jgi:hypothetical protein